jgi:hypothetical protein
MKCIIIDYKTHLCDFSEVFGSSMFEDSEIAEIVKWFNLTKPTDVVEVDENEKLRSIYCGDIINTIRQGITDKIISWPLRTIEVE